MTQRGRSVFLTVLALAIAIFATSIEVSAKMSAALENGNIVLYYGEQKLMTLSDILLQNTARSSDSAKPFICRLERDTLNVRVDDNVSILVEWSESSKRFDICAVGPGSKYGRLSIRGVIDWVNPLLCRLTPGTNQYMVQTSLGPLSSTRCNSLFDIQNDRALTFTPQYDAVNLLPDKNGETYLIQASAEIEGATPTRLFSVKVTEGFYKAKGIKYYTPINKRRFPLPPSGWCSWYFYYQDVKEGDIKRNADWMYQVLKPFGAQYIQLDDGWQGIGHGTGENRDWETIDKRFSNGLKALSDYIHSLGMKSGLWLAPHGQSNDEFVKANQDAFIWKADGSSIGYKIDPKTHNEKEINWEGRYIVDTSGEAGQAYMHRLFDRLANGYGIDYFKIDGQPIVEDLYKTYRSRLDSTAVEPLDSYRAGLNAIRNVIGPDRFLLGCWGTPLSGIGIMNGSRTGGDVAANWKGFGPALDATLNNYYLHNIVWYCDPDVLCVRSPLTLNQARAWASLYGLTGQILMASDRMYSLPPDRVEILKRVYPAVDVKPVDLYQYKKKVDTWDLKVSKPWGTWDVVGLFNWSTSAAGKKMELNLDSLGNTTQGDKYHLFDFWDHKYLGQVSGKQEFSLPSTSCKVLAVTPVQECPQIISTSRHITQGWLDLNDVRWSPENKVLSGTSTVIGGDTYRIYIAAPSSFRERNITCEAFDRYGKKAEASIERDGALIILNIASESSTDATWKVTF